MQRHMTRMDMAHKTVVRNVPKVQFRISDNGVASVAPNQLLQHPEVRAQLAAVTQLRIAAVQRRK